MDKFRFGKVTCIERGNKYSSVVVPVYGGLQRIVCWVPGYTVASDACSLVPEAPE
jgi:hypothetical protein